MAPHVRRTPLERSTTLSRHLGTNAYIKAELFQKTGSFKVRGAFNKLLSIGPASLGRGVVAVSGGNHAQAVAYVARELGVPAHVFMPQATPRNYVDGTASYGAEISFVPSAQDGFAAIGDYVEMGWVAVHPFDDPLVMAGQGTAALEILEDVPHITDIVASIGGGGLISGLAIAIKALKPGVRVWGVETEGADCMSKALAAGHPVTLPAITSIARTLGAPSASEDTLAIVQRYVESVTVVSDADAVTALRLLLERTKMLAEPAASCTLAAAERLREHFGPDRHVVLFLCGGNVGLDALCGYR